MERNTVLLIPTGDEIRCGVVLDTDSPMIRDILTSARPGCEVSLSEPLADDEDVIAEVINASAGEGFSLIVLIGGSGGGHRHSLTLAGDFTHTALDRILESKHCTSLYGWNGHLWSRLVCGYVRETLVINVPGPYQEAKAAIEAFAAIWGAGEADPETVNAAMAAAVSRQYGDQRTRSLLREELL